ncbi:GDSL esterase/lipase 2-like isoform X2 [Corylus avellana]|uniref:GDSL esterase/lipase 2-like isoform X2 n=1 Tax=Corylus avellana TaxID=13451 RepID=UPI001E22F043|nr:GDSL esterase/lipase 2-like isoform X2 [Corylus avellana]
MMGLSFHLCFLVLCGSLIIPTKCLAQTCLPEDHVALFIFGDSLFDAGNNNYINTTTDFQANVWPYGETFFKYPTGRPSDGRLIPDFIAEYAKLPLTPPYLHPAGYHRYTDGANFASSGAGALVETHPGFVIDLNTQLKYFKNVETMLKRKVGETQAKKLLSRAVYLINIGGNDYLAPFTTNSSVLRSYSPQEYVDMVIGNLTTVIKEIHKKGGRKFGFLSVAPLGFFPYTKALIAPGNSFKEGKMACCGTGPYRGIPSCGGKRSVKEYELCGNASEYLFFDSIHPSEKTNEQLAKLLWNGNLDVTWPYNLKALIEHK